MVDKETRERLKIEKIKVLVTVLEAMELDEDAPVFSEPKFKNVLEDREGAKRKLNELIASL